MAGKKIVNSFVKGGKIPKAKSAPKKNILKSGGSK